MGIETFISTFLQRTNSSVTSIDNVFSLLVDYNCLIYDYINDLLRNTAFKKKEDSEKDYVFTGTDFRNLLFRKFDECASNLIKVFEKYKPSGYFGIVIDGYPYQGKIRQQKIRRYSPTRIYIGNDLVFSTAFIAPCTDFMEEIEESIRKVLKTYDFGNTKVIVSLSSVYCEGEHKIMNIIRSPLFRDNGGNHIVLSNDSDTSILLSVTGVPNTYFVSRKVTRGYINFENYSIDTFKAFLMRILRHHNTDVASREFMVISFLLGNDFLPLLRPFIDLSESINEICKVYRPDRPLICNGSFNLNNFTLLISELRKIELELLVRNRVKQGFDIPLTATANPQPDLMEYNVQWINHILSFDGGELEERIKSMCKSYMKTFVNVIHYYLGCEITNEYYLYSHPPSIHMLYCYLISLTDTKKRASLTRLFVPIDVEYHDRKSNISEKSLLVNILDEPEIEYLRQISEHYKREDPIVLYRSNVDTEFTKAFEKPVVDKVSCLRFRESYIQYIPPVDINSVIEDFESKFPDINRKRPSIGLLSGKTYILKETGAGKFDRRNIEELSTLVTKVKSTGSSGVVKQQTKYKMVESIEL